MSIWRAQLRKTSNALTLRMIQCFTSLKRVCTACVSTSTWQCSPRGLAHHCPTGLSGVGSNNYLRDADRRRPPRRCHVVVSRRTCVVNRLINAARTPGANHNIKRRTAGRHARPYDDYIDVHSSRRVPADAKPRSINSGARPIHPDHLSFRLIYVTCMPDRPMEHIVNVVSAIPTAVLVSDIGSSIVLARASAYIRHTDGMLPV